MAVIMLRPKQVSISLLSKICNHFLNTKDHFNAAVLTYPEHQDALLLLFLRSLNIHRLTSHHISNCRSLVAQQERLSSPCKQPLLLTTRQHCGPVERLDNLPRLRDIGECKHLMRSAKNIW